MNKAHMTLYLAIFFHEIPLQPSFQAGIDHLNC